MSTCHYPHAAVGGSSISSFLFSDDYDDPFEEDLLVSPDFENMIHQGEGFGASGSFFTDDDDSVAYEDDADLLSDFENTINSGCRGFGSLTSACRLLQLEIKHDLSSFDSMEREMALDYVKDKLEVRRGLRGLPSLSPRLCKKPLTNNQRMTALKYVKGRVSDLRQARNAKKNMVPTKAKQVVKRDSKSAKPTKRRPKRRLTKMAERKKENRTPLSPLGSSTNIQSVSNKKTKKSLV